MHINIYLLRLLRMTYPPRRLLHSDSDVNGDEHEAELTRRTILPFPRRGGAICSYLFKSECANKTMHRRTRHSRRVESGETGITQLGCTATLEQVM